MLPDTVQSHKYVVTARSGDTVLLYRRASPSPMIADRRVRPHVLSIPNESITISNYELLGLIVFKIFKNSGQ